MYVRMPQMLGANPRAFRKHHFELAIDRIQAEMNILQMCKHPNVITLHGTKMVHAFRLQSSVT
jgi:hypothetical protein